MGKLHNLGVILCLFVFISLHELCSFFSRMIFLCTLSKTIGTKHTEKNSEECFNLDNYSERVKNTQDTWLVLFGCACDKYLVLGAGGRPPEDEGGGFSNGFDGTGSETSDEYLTAFQTPQSESSSIENYSTSVPLPLGPGQWPGPA